jgi:hypothetical protein
MTYIILSSPVWGSPGLRILMLRGNMEQNKAISYKLLITFPLLLFLTSCAAGNAQFTAETPAGFWYGLWHGIISFISLVIHLFNPDVMVYEVNNTGGWYDFGFLLGVCCFWGGGSKVVYKYPVKRS